MKPITFSCTQQLPQSAVVIAEQLLCLEKWTEFQGYGPIPGIRQAEFEVRTGEIVGTRIRVTSTDGSTHVEESMGWEPGRRVQLRMKEFSPPVSRLARHFDETWLFEPDAGGTRVQRVFELHPQSLPAKLLLRLVAVFLRRAITRQLRQMKTAASGEMQ